MSELKKKQKQKKDKRPERGRRETNNQAWYLKTIATKSFIFKTFIFDRQITIYMEKTSLDH